MGQQTTDHCHPDALLVGQVGEGTVFVGGRYVEGTVTVEGAVPADGRLRKADRE